LPAKKQLGPRAQRKAERPGEILDAAFELFVEHGYLATRVEDIAERLGVTKGTVYFYFDTKELLFEETLRHACVPFTDVQAEVEKLEGPYADRIRAFVRVVYSRICADRKSRELLRLAIAEGARFPHVVDRQFDEQILPMFNAARDLFQAGVDAGELHCPALLQFPQLAISATMQMIVWDLLFFDRKPIDAEAFIEAHLDLLLHGALKHARTPEPAEGSSVS